MSRKQSKVKVLAKNLSSNADREQAVLLVNKVSPLASTVHRQQFYDGISGTTIDEPVKRRVIVGATNWLVFTGLTLVTWKVGWTPIHHVPGHSGVHAGPPPCPK